MENYLVVRAEEERRRKRTIWTTDNLKSVLELWIQSLPYMTEKWIPDFIYCSVRARAWLLHDGQQRGHQQLQGHPPGDGQVAWADDLDDDYCHSDDDCRSEDVCRSHWWSWWWQLSLWRWLSLWLMITMVSTAILMIVMAVTDKEKHSGEH